MKIKDNIGLPDNKDYEFDPLTMDIIRSYINDIFNRNIRLDNDNQLSNDIIHWSYFAQHCARQARNNSIRNMGSSEEMGQNHTRAIPEDRYESMGFV